MQKEIQQQFIQTCAAFGVIKTQLAKKILTDICQKYEVDVPDGEALKDFVKNISQELNQYNHDMCFIKYPILKEELIVFRSLNPKGGRLLNCFSELDSNYFGILIANIAVADSYSISGVEAINLSSLVQNGSMNRSRAEVLLQEWMNVGYFHDSGGNVFLGPRTMVELEPYLLDHFPESVKECTLCKKLLLWEPSCSACNTKFHLECIRKFLITSSNCPGCGEVWSTPLNW